MKAQIWIHDDVYSVIVTSQCSPTYDLSNKILYKKKIKMSGE